MSADKHYSDTSTGTKDNLSRAAYPKTTSTMSLTIDQVFQRIEGNGRYQKMLLLCMGYIYLSMVGFHVMVITFIAGEPTWECVNNSTSCNLTEPITTVSGHYMDRCKMARSEWKFSDTYTSTVTEYNLVCAKSIFQSVASSVFWVGWFVGNISIGYISDKFGRRNAMQLSTLLVFLFTWIIIWPKALWIFMVCRFLTGIGCGGACMCLFIILVEFSFSERRGFYGTTLWFISPISYSILALFAYLIRDWRYLMLAGALIATPVMLFVWFVPESPRYLLVHGKYDEARKELERVARWNKSVMPKEDIILPKLAVGENSDFRDLFHDKKTLVITITTWFTWFTVALMFYAVSYSSIYLGGNIYLSFFLTNIILLPANLLNVLAEKKFGRKKLLVAGLIIATITTIITAFIPLDRSNSAFTAGRIISAMVGKSFIFIAFVVIYLQGAELFPTTVRNVALGTSSACGRIGSFVALYIIWLERIHPLLPYIILGVLCLLCAVLCQIVLPETKKAVTLEVFAFESRENKMLMAK